MKSRLLKLISALCLVSLMLGAGALSVSAVQMSDWSSTKKATLPEYAYSFAVVGDTQVIARDETVTTAGTYNPKFAGNFDKIYDWIVANKSAKNIQFAFHMGDVTDWNNVSEWELAMENLSKLNYKIPYNIARGNHDGAPRMVGYYTTDVYKSSVNPGEEYGFFDGRGIANYNVNALNAYQTVTVGDVMYLMLSLDMGPCKAVIEWANEVIAAHPYHNVIISTHSYLQGDYSKPVTGGGVYMDAPKDCSATQYNPGGYYNGGGYKENGSYVNWDFRLQQHKDGGDDYLYRDATYMLENLVQQHENISMVLCGHECSEYVKQISTTGKNGNTVLQFLVDGQEVDRDLQKQGAGHAGLVAMFYFSADGKKVTTEYYSTIRKQYLHDEGNTKTYDVHVVDVPQNIKGIYQIMHSINEADYSANDWAEISTALEAAKQTIATTTDATALNNAAKDLQASLEGKAKLDRSALNAALEAADGMVEADNTMESWTKFEVALKAAEMAKKAQSQAQITKAANSLNEAISNLKAPDYSALNAAIERAKQLDGRESEFDATAWKTFTTALQNAKKYTDSRSQSTISSVTRKLNSAITALIGEETPDTGEETTPESESQESASNKKDQKKKDGGCGSVITASAAVLATVLTLGVGFKKKED